MGCAIGPKGGLGRRASECRLRCVVVGVLLVLAGCGGQSHPHLPAGAERVALSAFPTAIGSGYPLGVLVQGGRRPTLGRDRLILRCCCQTGGTRRWQSSGGAQF